MLQRSPIRTCVAFTLIELLVVISIIATLAAILFPVFAQAKIAANKTEDLSHQKQITIAQLLYSGDCDDYFPRNDYFVASRRYDPLTWRELSAPYIENGIDQVTWDSINPPATVPYADAGVWTTPTEPPNSRYGYNANPGLYPSAEIWNNPTNVAKDGGIYNDQYRDGAPTGRAPAPSMRQTQLEHPASTLLMTSNGINLTDGSGSFYLGAGLAPWTPDPSPAGQGGYPSPNWDVDAYAPNGLDYSHKASGFGQFSSLPRYRFNNSANVAYADGHVASRVKGSIGWCKDMFVANSNVDPATPTPADIDDSWAFNTGQVCQGYSK